MGGVLGVPSGGSSAVMTDNGRMFTVTTHFEKTLWLLTIKNKKYFKHRYRTKGEEFIFKDCCHTTTAAIKSAMCKNKQA